MPWPTWQCRDSSVTATAAPDKDFATATDVDNVGAAVTAAAAQGLCYSGDRRRHCASLAGGAVSNKFQIARKMEIMGVRLHLG